MVAAKVSDSDDVQQICRSCLRQTSRLIPLQNTCEPNGKRKFGQAEYRETIGKLMMTCADVQIEADDGLPQNVCKKCISKIQAAIAYRQKCEQSDVELRRVFQQRLSNGVVKTEGNDTEAYENPVDERWFEEVETESIFEIDFKTEDTRPYTETAKALTPEDFESSSERTFDNDLAGNDDDMDFFDEAHGQDGEADAGVDKKYTCEVCGRVFNRKYNWKQHKLVHTDEKNFACHVCQQEYKSKSNLKRHLRSHSGENGKDKLRCDICSKTFTRVYALNVHKLGHSAVESEFSSEVRLQEESDSRNNADTQRNSESHRSERNIGNTTFTGKIFTCDICTKVFNRRYNFEQHQMIHTGGKNFACDICGGGFMKKSVLRRHLEKHVNDPKGSNDDQQNTQETQTTSEIHKKFKQINQSVGDRCNVKKEKVCEYCSKVFSRTYNLNQHRLIHTGGNLFPCDECGRQYKTRRSARSCSHRKSHSKKRRLRDDKTKISCSSELLVDSNTGAEIKEHIETHSKIELESRTGDQLNCSSSSRLVEKKKKICEFCSKEFSRTYNLNQHRLIHTGMQQYSCDICQQKYKAKRNLKMHILNRHVRSQKNATGMGLDGGTVFNKDRKSRKTEGREGNMYACEVCPKLFKTMNRLRQHHLVHSNVRKFSCDICNRRYKTKNHIRNHMRMHCTGSNVYTHLCSVCGNRYQNVTRLMEHMRQHTGERPFECEVCHKTFTTHYNLTTHRRTHALVKPHICEVCGRGFVVKDRLRVHMMLHTGERPYKCTVCSAGFVQGCLLKVHMRTHTGEMPYLCGICGTRYQHRSQILKHRRQFGHFETNDKNQLKQTVQKDTIKNELRT